MNKKNKKKIAYHITKRLFDILISAIVIVLLWPLMFVIAIVIRVDSPGNPIFVQDRAGKNYRTIKCWKFRTMYVGSSMNNLAAPKEGDRRVTRVGAFLRKTSLDELPQLFNVLAGTISLIGPRVIPEKEIQLRIEKLLEEFPDETCLADEYRSKRMKVKPGITGMAQAFGRSSISIKQGIEDDLYYIDNESVKLDATILLRTIKTVLCFEGVN